MTQIFSGTYAMKEMRAAFESKFPNQWHTKNAEGMKAIPKSKGFWTDTRKGRNTMKCIYLLYTLGFSTVTISSLFNLTYFQTQLATARYILS